MARHSPCQSKLVLRFLSFVSFAGLMVTITIIPVVKNSFSICASAGKPSLDPPSRKEPHDVPPTGGNAELPPIERPGNETDSSQNVHAEGQATEGSSKHTEKRSASPSDKENSQAPFVGAQRKNMRPGSTALPGFEGRTHLQRVLNGGSNTDRKTRLGEGSRQEHKDSTGGCQVGEFVGEVYPMDYALPSSQWIQSSVDRGNEEYRAAKKRAGAFGQLLERNLSCSPKKLADEMKTVFYKWAEMTRGVKFSSSSKAKKGIDILLESAARYGLAGSNRRSLQCAKAKQSRLFRRRGHCRKDEKDLIWRIVDRVSLCGASKRIVCSLLQPNLQNLRRQGPSVVQNEDTSST